MALPAKPDIAISPPLLPANAGIQIIKRDAGMSFYVYIVAKRRERQIKAWRRSWKLMLIEAANATWSDLYETLDR